MAAAGHFDWERLVGLVERHCAGWPTGPAPRDGIRETQGSGDFRVVTRDKVAQEHVIVISPGPPADSPLRYAADTLAVAIGDDSGSRLYWSLIDPGLADSADTSFHDYEGTGSFFTSFSCAPENSERDLAIVFDILHEVQKNSITEAELNQAKSKILSRVVRASERPLGRMQALGMAWTYLHQYRSVDDDLKAFDEVSLKSIRELLERYPIDHTTTLGLGPLRTLPRPNGRGSR
jgi:predicted Zn-dependent peptidase